MKSTAYPTLDGLVDLACRDGVDVRPTLLRVVTDLYVQKPTHSTDETTRYVELALGLIESVDDATRAAVAASLAGYAAAPAAVLARLGRTAAAEVTPSAEVANATASTESDDLIELFFTATSEDRRLILFNLDAAAMSSVHLPSPAAAAVIAKLETAALQRNSRVFSRTLARDPSGEPIVVAARSLGMKAAVLQRILLFLNPSVGQSVQRVYELADLFDALPREAAERMLAIWRGAGAVPAPGHEPVYQNSPARQARPLAAVWDSLVPEQPPARLKSAR